MVIWPHKYSWKTIGFFCISAVLVFLLFKPAFSSYFFQDDWFSLRISQAHSTGDFLRFFLPVEGVVYYRPLGMQLPFFISQILFGLTPVPLRVATFGIHLINGWLVYTLLKKILDNTSFALAGAFLYVTSATHMIIFYWAATIAFVLAPLFYLQSVLNFLDKKEWRSWIWFVVGLFVNELLITLPLAITAYTFINNKTEIKKTIKFWVAAVVYFIFRLKAASFPADEGYTFLTSFHEIAINLRNYLLWVFNWPDEITNQFASFVRLNPEFTRGFAKYISIWTMETVLLLLCFIFIPIIFTKRKTIKSELKLISFGLLWFIGTLSPVLFFSKHFFSYYLSLPLVGLLIFFGAFWQYTQVASIQKYKLLVLFVICGVWYWSAISTMEFNTNIHWSVRRATRSYVLTTRLQNTYPMLPSNAVVLIPPKSDEENKWALGESNALKRLYRNPNLETYFGSRDEYLADFPDSHQQIFVLP